MIFRNNILPMRNVMLCALLFCIALPGAANAARAIPLIAERVENAQPLLPYCSWLMDDSGELGIGDVSTGSLPGAFVAFSHPPFKAYGPVWIRITLFKASAPAGGSIGIGGRSRLVVNLGQIQNGRNEIYYSEAPGPVGASDIWHSEEIKPYEDILLPEPGLTPMSVFIRLEQMPGPWFAPVVQAEHTARPAVLPPELLLPGLLIAAAIACLLRALAGRAQWALWAALFLSTGIYQTVMPLPGAERGFVFADLPALLAPGLAIILLPHVGRCLFSADHESKWRNGPLYFCSLLGAGAALAPLVPGFDWLARLFPLAPLLLLPLLPICINALAAKKPGSLAFFGATAMPLLGAGFSLYALWGTNINPVAGVLTSQGGLWGMAVGGLGLALSRVAASEPAAWLPEQTPEPLTELALSDVVWLDEAGTQESEPDKAQSNAISNQYAGLQPMPETSAGNAIVSQPSETGAQNDAPETDSNSRDYNDPALQFAHDGFFPQMPVVDGAAYMVWPSEPQNERDNGQEPEADASGETGPMVADAPVSPDDNAPQIAETTADGDFSGARPKSVTDPKNWINPEDATSLEGDINPEDVTSLEYETGSERQGPDANLGTPPSAPRQTPAPQTGPYPLLPPFAETGDSTLPNMEGEVISLIDDDFSSYVPAAANGADNAPARHITLATGGGYLFNLHALVREVHDVIAPVAKSRGLIFSWFVAPSLPVLLEGDAPRLRAALSLLLQSAVQASHEGAVLLSVRHRPESTRPEDLLFTISDNGSAQRTDAGFFHAWELAAKSGGSFNVDYSQTGGTRISFSVRFALPSGQTAREHLSLAPVSDELADTPGDELARITAFDLPMAEDDPSNASSALPGSASDATSGADRPLFDQAGTVHSFASAKHSVRKDYFARILLENPHRLSAPLSDQIIEHHRDLLAGRNAAPCGKSAQRQGALPGLRIVIAEMTSGKRKLLADYLRNSPYDLVYADSSAELPGLGADGVPTLYLFDGDMPEPDIIAAMTALNGTKQCATSPAPLLVLAGHENQAARLRQAGISHTLTKPFGPGELRAAVARAMLDFGLNQEPADADGADSAQPESEQADKEEYRADRAAMRNLTEAASHADAGEVDLLARALRAAPAQSSAPPLKVDLPRRHGISSLHLTSGKTVHRANSRLTQKMTPEQDLPVEDTPAAALLPDGAESFARRDHSDSLLDFALPENHVPGSVEPEQESIAKALSLTETPEDAAPATAAPIVQSAPTAEAPGGELETLFEPACTLAEETPDDQDAASHLPLPDEETQEPDAAQRFPLPGIDGEHLDVSIIPLAPGIIHALGDILKEAADAKVKGSTILMQDATGRLAARAEHFGLHKLGKIARCTERAAEADDMEAAATLFDDLEPVTRRYMTAINQCFQSFMNLER